MKKRVAVGITTLVACVILLACLVFLVPHLQKTEPNLFSNLIISAMPLSIALQVLGAATIAFLIVKAKRTGIKRTFPVRNYFLAISMVFTIYLINYYITLLPYGYFAVQLISFVLKISIYAILLPYIFTAQICYLFLMLRGEAGDS
jgi:hypothetical protein